MRWALFAAAGIIAGCARQGPLSDDPKLAARQLEKLVPRGMTEPGAIQALRARGFTFSRLSTDRAPNHLLIATGVAGDRVWQVGVIVVHAEVAATTVTVTDTARH